MGKILVTGGAGFIGSNLVDYLLEHTDDNVFNLDALTYAAHIDHATQLNHERYHFIKGDIRDCEFIGQLFKENEFTQVYHLAAESHVDNSIENPQVFIETNISSTV